MDSTNPGSSLGDEVHLDDETRPDETIDRFEQHDDEEVSNTLDDTEEHHEEVSNSNSNDQYDSRSSPELLQVNEEENDLDLSFQKPQEDVKLDATVKQEPPPEESKLQTTEVVKEEMKEVPLAPSGEFDKPKEKVEAKKEEEFDVISPESIEKREQLKKAAIGGAIALGVLIGGILIVRKLRH